MARLAKEQIAATAPVVDLRIRGVGGSPAGCLAGASDQPFGPTVPEATGLTGTRYPPSNPKTHFSLATADR